MGQTAYLTHLPQTNIYAFKATQSSHWSYFVWYTHLEPQKTSVENACVLKKNTHLLKQLFNAHSDKGKIRMKTLRIRFPPQQNGFISRIRDPFRFIQVYINPSILEVSFGLLRVHSFSKKPRSTLPQSSFGEHGFLRLGRAQGLGPGYAMDAMGLRQCLVFF